MLCKNPYMMGTTPFGCGQCMPCRLNRRRLWSHRIMLESLKHQHSAFVTLTYDDKHLPKNNSLNKEHLQLWLKKIRKLYAPQKLRFFAVGEYGTSGQRGLNPHYHLALFGSLPCFHPEKDQYQRKKCHCPSCTDIRKTWGYGDTDNAYLTHDSAQYICGYVTKKLTKKSDFLDSLGIIPEFARMSLRPGIGAHAMEDVAETLMTEHGCDLIGNLGDIPTQLAHGKKMKPLGRYLSQKLRERLGHDKKVPLEVLQKNNQEMHELFKATLGDQISKNQTIRSIQKKNFLLDLNKQKVLNLETKSKLYSKKGSL